MTAVGFIGLGSMGLPMAKNLVARGFAVRGFDVRSSAIENLTAAGGLRASGPRVQAAYGGDAGARGLVGVNRGTTGEAPTIRRRP